MNTVNNTKEFGGLSIRNAALIAGFGLLVMTICAPLAHFYFMAQSIVLDDAAATTENLQGNGNPYLIGVVLLFITYVMDVIVAWSLYWYLRPDQTALALLVAWARLVYTAVAVIGLAAGFLGVVMVLWPGFDWTSGGITLITITMATFGMFRLAAMVPSFSGTGPAG